MTCTTSRWNICNTPLTNTHTTKSRSHNISNEYRICNKKTPTTFSMQHVAYLADHLNGAFDEDLLRPPIVFSHCLKEPLHRPQITIDRFLANINILLQGINSKRWKYPLRDCTQILTYTAYLTGLRARIKLFG